MASSSEPPWAPRASVRAMMTKSGSRLLARLVGRAVLADRLLERDHPAPGHVAAALGITWSSMWMAATPVWMYSRTVRITLMALP